VNTPLETTLKCLPILSRLPNRTSGTDGIEYGSPYLEYAFTKGAIMNVYKRLTLLLGLFLGISPLANAYQILPNPNPVGSTIYIDASDIAENFINFVNEGTVVMYPFSTFNNFANFYNSGIFDGYYSQLNNTGTLTTAASGNLGMGVIANQGTGVINNNGETWIYSSLNNAGTVNNNGFFIIFEGTLHNTGTLKNEDILSIHHSALFNGGTLQSNGHIDNDAYVYNNGTITGSGTYSQFYLDSKTVNDGVFTQSTIHVYEGILSGTGVFNGNVILDGAPSYSATIAPGNSIGTLTINGNLTSAGNLDFEVGGIGLGQYDVLHINGNADFTGGNLEFDFIDGFKPTAGNSFDFLLADNVTGWNNLNIILKGLDAGLIAHFAQLEGGGVGLFISEVPEPGTNAMLLAGLGLLGFRIRPRKLELPVCQC